jgi:hypothetical protein
MDSDRDRKHDVHAIDADVVLERLAGLQVTSWRYDAAPDELHMGPMAQDFHQAFGLGRDHRAIAPVDANGVTMAALQALHRRVAGLEARGATRERDNADLRAEVSALRRELERRCR